MVLTATGRQWLSSSRREQSMQCAMVPWHKGRAGPGDTSLLFLSDCTVPQTSAGQPTSRLRAQAVGSSIKTGHWGPDRSLASVEHLIWLGDLNYRLFLADAKVPRLLLSCHQLVASLPVPA